MCCRYSVRRDGFKVIIQEANEREDPSYSHVSINGDVCPGVAAPVMIESGYVGMKWGFSGQNGMTINARAETAAEKPMFRNSVRQWRCLVPADGYYEWNEKKEKFYFTKSNGNMLFMAGLYRMGDDGKWQFVIVTRDSYGPAKPVHDRMPLLIRDRKQWFSYGTEALLTLGEEEELSSECQSPQQLSFF